jgi:hypothetical protein
MQAALPLEEVHLAEWVKTHIEPDADRLDSDSRLLSDRWQAFCKLGFHELGSSRRATDLFEVLPLVARSSAAFALLLYQQILANRSLVVAESDAWPRAGLALDALKSPEPSTAHWRDGYLNGTIESALAPSFFDYLLVGFSLEDGSEAVAWVYAEDRAGLRLKGTNERFAANSLRVQNIAFENLEVSEDQITRIGPTGTCLSWESKRQLDRGLFLLGNLEASVSLMEQGGAAAPKARKIVHEFWTKITRLKEAPTNGETRSLVSELADAAIRFSAVAFARSGEFGRTQPAQRLSREALLFVALGADQPLLNAFEDRILG